MNLICCLLEPYKSSFYIVQLTPRVKLVVRHISDAQKSNSILFSMSKQHKINLCMTTLLLYIHTYEIIYPKKFSSVLSLSMVATYQYLVLTLVSVQKQKLNFTKYKLYQKLEESLFFPTFLQIDPYSVHKFHYIVIVVKRNVHFSKLSIVHYVRRSQLQRN